MPPETSTLIELYDPKTHLYNALGVMLFRPERVIFLIPEHSSHVYNKFKEEYKQLWENHGCMPSKTVCILTKTSDISLLSETILSLCGENTIIDIEGGTPELYLAAGCVLANAPGGTRCIRADFKDEKIYEFKQGEPTRTRHFTTEELSRIAVSVEESIRMYGGEITKDSFTELLKKGMTKDEIIKEAQLFENAIENSVGRKWNDIVPERIRAHDPEKLTICIQENDFRHRDVKSAVSAIERVGLISKARSSGSRIFYKCSSPLVYSCFLKSGEALELYTLSLALSIEGVTDARCGVSVSFYGNEGCSDNEIDCIFMRGTTPVFVSCKNGRVSSDELYKFHTVSHQFGGNEYISLLVAPHFAASDEKYANICDRALLYRIALLTDFSGKTNADAVEYLRSKTDERRKTRLTES